MHTVLPEAFATMDYIPSPVTRSFDAKTFMYRFALSRLWGQDPIRYSGHGRIPSKAQILELDKVRKQIG